MAYEVGIAKTSLNASYLLKCGDPIVDNIICTCNNIKDAMLVARNNETRGYFSIIRNKIDNIWFPYMEYPRDRIDNLYFETKQFTNVYCEAMLDKINEIIDYINKHE